MALAADLAVAEAGATAALALGTGAATAVAAATVMVAAAELAPVMVSADQAAEVRGFRALVLDQVPAAELAMETATAAANLQMLRAKAVLAAGQVLAQGHGVAGVLDPDTTRLNPERSFEI
jgi:hypothetical protein